jgi:protein SCO1
MRFLDDAVSFDTYKPRWPVANQTTALAEICRTLQWMGPCAAGSVADLKQLCGDIYVSDKIKSELQKVVAIIEEAGKQPYHACCDLIVRRQHDSSRTPQCTSDVADLVLEDHGGNPLPYSAYFTGKPAIVVFFYTRCDNPNKCSSTITRLGEFQSALADAGLESEVRIAAVTYDPLYDLPFRLDSYCRNRGMVLNDDSRAFRIPAGMTQMLRYFDSGVSYIGSIVNQHATELFIVGSDGQITDRFQQLQWQVPEVMAQLRKQLSRDRRQRDSCRL